MTPRGSANIITRRFRYMFLLILARFSFFQHIDWAWTNKHNFSWQSDKILQPTLSTVLQCLIILIHLRCQFMCNLQQPCRISYRLTGHYFVSWKIAKSLPSPSTANCYILFLSFISSPINTPLNMRQMSPLTKFICLSQVSIYLDK